MQAFLKLFLLTLIVTNSFSDILNDRQKNVLNTVREVARTMPDITGETYENTIAAICLTESSAGKEVIGDLKPGKDSVLKASLGVLQVQIGTARYVSKKVKSLAFIKNWSDKKLANKLLTDVRFSAKIALNYFLINKNRFYIRGYKDSYFKAISLYNGGLKNYPYYKRVKKNYKLVEKLIKRGEIK
jgi:hypothetical protein